MFHFCGQHRVAAYTRRPLCVSSIADGDMKSCFKKMYNVMIAFNN